MKKILNYKILLTFWVAFGVSASGYLFINKNEIIEEAKYDMIPVGDGKGGFYHKKFLTSKPITITEKMFQYCILGTSVGAIIIGGVGLSLTKKT